MRRLKRIGLIIAGIFALSAAYRIFGVYELRSGECSARPARTFANTYPKYLKVMTYNIEGHASLMKSHHIEEIAAEIRKHNPDVVGLNEVHRGTWQPRFGDHTRQLAKLTGMNVLFGRSYTFLGGDFGNAVLTRGQILSSDVHELPGIGEPRTLLEATIRVKGGVIEFYVGHTAAWAAINQKPRDLQLQCMNDQLRASAHPLILVGDLNAPPKSSEVAKFLQGNSLQFVGNPEAPTHKLVEQRLDYILADRGWQVRSAYVLDEGPSDHRPVVAELVHP